MPSSCLSHIGPRGPGTPAALLCDARCTSPGAGSTDLSFVKTSNDVSTGEVIVAKAQQQEPGAIRVQRASTQNSFSFGFWKPRDALYPGNYRRRHGLVFPMNERVSVPRTNRGEGDDEAAP